MPLQDALELGRGSLCPPPCNLFNTELHENLPNCKDFEFVEKDYPPPAAGSRRCYSDLDALRGRTKFCTDLAIAARSAIHQSTSTCPGTKGCRRPSGHRRERRGRRAAGAGLASCSVTVMRELCTGGLELRPVVDMPSTEASRTRALSLPLPRWRSGGGDTSAFDGASGPGDVPGKVAVFSRPLRVRVSSLHR